MAIDVTGRLAETPNISGRITIVSMDITVPDRFDSVTAPIPGTRHLNPTPTARARLALRAREQAARARAPLFNATLALTISAANRILLHGRGINAEAAGDLHVAGSARDPQVTGGFELLRGSLSLAGKRLVFTRGSVRFHGDVTPELDLVAETSAAGVTARISVSGPASQPSFAITSTPSLPEDEILSRVLFQQSSGSLSPFQAIELANSAATLSGRGDAFEPLRRSLGLGSLNSARARPGAATPARNWPHDQRPDQRQRHKRSEAGGQWRFRQSRRHPPHPPAGGRRRERRIERRRRRRMGIQIIVDRRSLVGIRRFAEGPINGWNRRGKTLISTGERQAPTVRAQSDAAPMPSPCQLLPTPCQVLASGAHCGIEQFQAFSRIRTSTLPLGGTVPNSTLFFRASSFRRLSPIRAAGVF